MPKEMGESVRDTIGVDNYEEFVKKIEKEGGKMLSKKMKVPKMGYMGIFQDTEGNVFSIIEAKMEGM